MIEHKTKHLVLVLFLFYDELWVFSIALSR